MYKNGRVAIFLEEKRGFYGMQSENTGRQDHCVFEHGHHTVVLLPVYRS